MLKKQSTKKIVELVIAVVVLTICGFVIFKTLTKDDSTSADFLGPAVNRQENVEKFKKAIQVFEDAKFQNLIKFGNWPVVAGEKGRSNPFIKL